MAGLAQAQAAVEVTLGRVLPRRGAGAIVRAVMHLSFWVGES
jgi:hypothetical protein